MATCRVGGGGSVGNRAFSQAMSDAQGSAGLETGSRQQGGMRSDRILGESARITSCQTETCNMISYSVQNFACSSCCAPRTCRMSGSHDCAAAALTVKRALAAVLGWFSLGALRCACGVGTARRRGGAARGVQRVVASLDTDNDAYMGE